MSSSASVMSRRGPGFRGGIPSLARGGRQKKTMTDIPTNDARADLSSIAIRLFCFFFLSFVAGAAVYAFQVFPHKHLKNAFAAARAEYHHLTSGGMRFFLWVPATRDEKGVTKHDPDAAFAGLTLMMSTDAQGARLVNMAGRTVHSWTRPFSSLWPDPPHVDSPVADEFIFWRAAHLYPNGDLLVIYVADGVTPWGYGLAKLDKDSNVIWAYAGRVHHDLSVGADGRIYTLTHEIITERREAAGNIEPPYIDDFVVVLSPDGKELQRVSVLEALARSDYPGVMDRIAATAGGTGDILHTNTVELVRRPFTHDGLTFRPGQVIISFRSLNTIALLDLETKRIEWMLRGGWQGQHDPDLLSNGNIMLFDNLGHLGSGGATRIIEFDPATGEIVWQYSGSDDAPFYSSWRGRQQKLPNGNVLITESSGGRVFEVTPDKRIVWEYVNPVRGGSSDAYIPWLTGGQRFTREELPFLNDQSS